MRVLTIKQPWVGAIFTLGKDIENRSWSTSYRGDLIIHASAARSCDESAREIRDGAGKAWGRGHIIGVVNMVDCVKDSRSKWADPGSWHWVLRDPRLLKTPIAYRGRLGLWLLDPDLLARICKDMSR